MQRSDFVDWMKALGISLIVYGHVAHATTVALTPPIYLKQLGVVCFLFVTGFNLARERRPPAEAVFTRVFPVVLFGVTCALLMTLIGLAFGTGLATSNYLPFFLGANVVFNNFPANPTTWYLGTYLHLLLLWLLVLRHIEVRLWLIAAALLIEVPVRAALTLTAGPFVAYMLLTNWASVVLLGLYMGRRTSAEPRAGAWPYVAAFIAAIAAWALAIGALPLDPTFPFMTLTGTSVVAGALAVSAGVSILYVFTARLVFEAARRAPAPAPIKFIARNSLIIFLGHMPVYLALGPLLVTWGFSYWGRVAVQLLICLAGLALVSEVINRLVLPKSLAVRALDALDHRFDVRRAIPVTSWGSR